VWKQLRFSVLSCTFLFGFFLILKGQEPLSQKLDTANQLIYSNPEKAIEIAQEIYAQSNENKSLKLSALLTLGTAYSEKFDLEKSIETLLEAVEIAKSENDYINQIRALSLLGYQYQIMQINDKTHAYLDEAESVMDQHGLPDSLMYLRGNNYSIKALTYQQSLDCGFAVDYFNKAILIYKSLENNEISRTNLSIAYLNKAVCFLENKNPDSARLALTQSDLILDELDSVEEDISISQEIAWAKYYLQTRDYKKSVEILNENLSKVKELSQVGMDLDIYQLLSQNYLALNDMGQYNYYSNLYIETQKKISEAEKKSITHIINKPPETKKTSTGNSSKTFSVVILILAVILGLILFFSIKSFRLKKKLKKLKLNQDLDS